MWNWKDIPNTEAFSEFLDKQANHEGIRVDELKQKMVAQGIMRYLIHLLGSGQLSVTEYVNLRPDIHWVEALRMAYVGGGLKLDPDFGQLLRGQITPQIERLRHDNEDH